MGRPFPGLVGQDAIVDQLWTNRAASAEAAIAKRHLRRLWRLPATQLGVVGWPPSRKDLAFGTWHYWWQAHLLDLSLIHISEPTRPY